MTTVEPPAPPAKAPSLFARRGKRSQTSLLARGEPMLWLTGGGLITSLIMVVGLIALILYFGIGTLWPVALVQVELHGGKSYMGEVFDEQYFVPGEEVYLALPENQQAAARQYVQDNGGKSKRRMIRTGNYDITNTHFHWVSDFEVAKESVPERAVLVERLSWGRFYGTPKAFLLEGKETATTPETIWTEFNAQHPGVLNRVSERHSLEEHDIGHINARLENARLALRAAELRQGVAAPEVIAAAPAVQAAQKYLAEVQQWADTEFAKIRGKIDALNKENARFQITLTTADGVDKTIPLDEIVRLFEPNRLTLGGKAGVYVSRWGEFLLEAPREANSEGGVFPAIWGTVVMTLIMSVMVVPFGVFAALYLREYAKGGVIISAIRIAINNLAGVPSIVFGVFGLGFFCYAVGANIDELLFSAKLPNPTFGKGGIFWASLTLALLTLPVVIVATEEALAAVPRSMREGSYACGASKWQTISRIVLPRAMPGIMTGMILAMARGAGEVAPLMLVGAVKLAPELPLDGTVPFVHLERSFMHLGFHIYDLGFQSANSEAAKPMVYTTTLLLIGVIATMNLSAVYLRMRLRRKFVGGEF